MHAGENHWTRDAAKAHVVAVRSLHDAGHVPAKERARVRLRLIQLTRAVERGAISAGEAERAFLVIVESLRAPAQELRAAA